jgi:hypothetical protein
LHPRASSCGLHQQAHVRLEFLMSVTYVTEYNHVEAIMVSVPASDIQKNFGEWHDKAYEGPIEITRYGRSTAFLVSAKLFHELWACYRKALPISALSESEIASIMSSEIRTNEPYRLDDIKDVDQSPSFGR